MRIFLSFFILLFCVSCSLENNENVAMEDSASISFDTSWGKDVQTRGNVMADHSIHEIGIFAKMKSDGDWKDGESFDDPSSFFMDNVNFLRTWVPAKKDWSKWDYTPHHYWPENENQKINFFAYAPRRDSASLNLADNHVRLYHSTSKENVDLVWARSLNQNKSTVSKSKNKVELQFKHSLAKISFKILSDALDRDTVNGAQVILKSVNLCAYPNGSGGVFVDEGYFNFITEQWEKDDTHSPRTVYTWTSKTDTNNKKDFLLSSDKINYEDTTITVSNNSYLFILPQMKYQSFYLVVDYVLKHADGMEEQRQVKGLVKVNPELPMKFVAGKAYNFVLNIPLNRIQVDVDTEVEKRPSKAKKTRADGTNVGIEKFIDGSELGLFAFHAQNSTTTSKTLFMSKLNKTTEGEKLTYRASDSTWNYSPKRFWPQTGILYFYAGYPNAFTYENGEVHFTSQSYNPFGVDFLWGLCNVECASHSNPVNIKMKHALARVNIYFDGYGDVDQVQVAACREGTFTSTSPEGIPIWTVNRSQENVLIGVKKNIKDPAAILFVFPGKINKLSFYSSLKKETIDLPNFDTDSPEFEAGMEYNINVSPSGINYYYVPPK